MITKKKAIEIAQEFIQNKSGPHNLVLLMEHTMEFDLGWVFFYQTKEYVITRDVTLMSEENPPIIINKNDGSLSVTGTAFPIEKYIRDYIQSKK